MGCERPNRLRTTGARRTAVDAIEAGLSRPVPGLCLSLRRISKNGEISPGSKDYLKHYPNGYTRHPIRPNCKVPADAEARKMD